MHTRRSRASWRLSPGVVVGFSLVFSGLFVSVAATTSPLVAPRAFGLPASTEAPSISTDKSSYSSNDTIIVSGFIPQAKDADVTVAITNPSGLTVATAEQTADEDSGGFTVAIRTGGPSWLQSGTYTATALFIGQQTISVNATFAYAAAADESGAPLFSTGGGGFGGRTVILIGTFLAVAVVVAAAILGIPRTRKSRLASIEGGTSCQEGFQQPFRLSSL